MSYAAESKLSRLMKIYGVTGRELAKALHVDYSLISKWKNNKRALQPRSTYVSMLAEYFISLDLSSGNKKIAGLLFKAYPEIDITISNTSSLLCQWLLEPDNILNEVVDNPSCILDIDTQNNMYNASFEVYQGKNGRRSVVLKFLDLAISLPEGQNLLLISQEDLSWLAEDKQFLNVWKSKLMEIILKKHKITIIHTVDRGVNELAAILQQWLPLHMSGCIESWYLPQYADTSTKTTLFIIQKIAAIYGIAEGASCEIYSAFYRDTATIAAYEGLYKILLSKCVPLLEKYPLKAPYHMFEKILNAIKTSENSFFFSNIPMTLSIPDELLSEVLETNNIAPEKAAYCHNILNQSSHLFTNMEKKYSCRHIYNYDILKQLASMDKIAYTDLSILAGCDIFLTGDQYKRHINHLISLMNTNDAFEIGLITNKNLELANNVNTWVRENSIVICTSSTESKYSIYAASASEPTVVNAFYHFYTNIWNSIPRIHRNKEWVMEALTKII